MLISAGISRRSLIAASSEGVFGQEPMPKVQAASIMFWAVRPASNCARGLVNTTAIAAAHPSRLAGRKTKGARSRRMVRSVTAMKRHGCRLRLLPLARPACTICSSAPSGIGRGRAPPTPPFGPPAPDRAVFQQFALDQVPLRLIQRSGVCLVEGAGTIRYAHAATNPSAVLNLRQLLGRLRELGGGA